MDQKAHPVKMVRSSAFLFYLKSGKNQCFLFTNLYGSNDGASCEMFGISRPHRIGVGLECAIRFTFWRIYT